MDDLSPDDKDKHNATMGITTGMWEKLNVDFLCPVIHSNNLRIDSTRRTVGFVCCSACRFNKHACD
jgi:hypothetical protein